MSTLLVRQYIITSSRDARQVLLLSTSAILLTCRKKVFYFIRPTPANLAAYERWSGTELQSNIWLGDMVDEVVKVTLYPGNTMIIPTGWIHAVVSPFLSSFGTTVTMKLSAHSQGFTRIWG